MNKFDGQKLVELIGLEASNEKVLDSLQALGMEMPSFGEKFEIDGRVAVYDDAETVDIVFVKNDNYSSSGEAVVEQVDFYDQAKVSFPFGLHKEDSFETVIKKIGRKPDFCSNLSHWNKQWVFSFRDTEIVYAVHFKQNMKSINTIVVAEFDRDTINKDPFISQCEELEE